MNTELSSKYDPSAVEAQAYQVWLDEKCFSADPAKPGPAYSIVIPPPNVTGALHLGHAINTTLQDILTRYHRMNGFNTLWVPGIDHAGIATQAVVERQLKEQENKTRHDVGRDGLVERIWQWKEQYGNRILEQLKRLGCSCDWDRTRFTLDEMCAKAVRETFFKLFKDGLIYRGKRLVNWDTFLQTSISDDEIYHENVKTFLWHIRYPIEEGTEGRSDEGTKGNAGEEGTEGRRREGTKGAELGGLTPSPLYSGERAGVRGRVSNDATRENPISSVGSAPRTESPKSATMVRSADPASASPDPRSSTPGHSPQPSPPSTGERESEARPAYMVVATTRPETMLGDTAVAVHSEDPRWNWAIGKFIRLPLTNRLIPIIADDILVDPKFGTGVVKVTPAHDPNDYAVWQRHKGQPDEIDLINILTPDGKITSDRPEWSKYAGMKRDAARKTVVEDLKAAGLLEKEEPYETQVGHSDRSKTPIEPYLSDQWFVKMAPLAEPALEVVREGKIKFYPERHAQQYLSWLGEKRDWPVSRQLWWGHRIPIWYKRMVITPENQFDQIVMQNLEHLIEQRDVLDTSAQYTSFATFVRCDTGERILDEQTLMQSSAEYDVYVCTTDDSRTLNLASNGFVQDPDVLDTWFSSALWPHSTLGWPDQTPELAKYYPTSVLLTGRDIITLWVARMVMMGMYNMGSGAPAPSPLYSGTRDGVRGEKSNDATSESAAVGFASANAETPPAAAGVLDSTRDNRPPSATAEDPRSLKRTLREDAAAVGATENPRAQSRSSTPAPSPQPSPPSTGEREQEMPRRGTGVSPVSSYSAQKDHGRDAHATAAEARALGLPFLDVAINPTILDGRGERMSKSKGNGVDPLDIIFSHGADALRFTLTNMATETQDARMPVQVVCPHCAERLPNPDNKDPEMVCAKCKKKLTRPINNATGTDDAPLARMTSDRFDLGRNFCNKLWNACRFALSNLEAEKGRRDEGTEGRSENAPPSSPSSLRASVPPSLSKPPSSLRPSVPSSLLDKWILSRFNTTVAECDAALKEYRFDVFAKACYDFFWGDFCDWYVEAIKPAMKDPARAGQTANVLCAVLDGSLRLMHPMIPFITETVWWRLNDVRPARGIPGRIDCPPSARLVLAQWPKAHAFDPAAEATFDRLKAVIVAIRTVRNDYQVNPRTPVPVSIKTAASAMSAIEANRELIELMGTCQLKAVSADLAPPANAVTASAGGCDLFIEGLIDPNAEKARLAKDIESRKKEIAAMQGRLGNEAYIAKAPAKLVQETKDKLAAAEAELGKLEEAARKLGT